jgi:radical SAM superfamily enzyme YgiQ (UPF0313 family)
MSRPGFFLDKRIEIRRSRLTVVSSRKGHAMDILDIKPYEICSIRPPTENHSLTFRLTRNCHWNRCAFCPVYKTGASFSRRSLDEIREDISRARKIDDFLFERGFGIPLYAESDLERCAPLIEKIQQARWEAGLLDDDITGRNEPGEAYSDPRLRWFLPWFSRGPGIAESLRHVLTWRIGGARTCFLGDADSLIHRPAFMADILASIKASFPTLERFTIYGRTSTAARLRSLADLKAYARSGLHRVHFGLESGSNDVLELVSKGVTAEEHITGCLKVRDAGLSCSIYVMPGLGGASLSDKHAEETAAVINAIGPDFIRLRSLEIFPLSSLETMRDRGEFVEASEEIVVREIRHLVESIDVATHIISDSASNMLNVTGRLPGDRDALLETIDAYLRLDPRKKLEYSLQSRLESFFGQYGFIADDIIAALTPFMGDRAINFSAMTDNDLACIIRLIRSKLMP